MLVGDGIVNLIGDEQAFCTDGAGERSPPSLTSTRAALIDIQCSERFDVSFNCSQFCP